MTDYTHKSFPKEHSLADLYGKVWGYSGLPFPAGMDTQGYLDSKNPLKGFEKTFKGIKNQYEKSASGVNKIVPLKMSDPNDSNKWELPIEVMVRVWMKQRVVKRYTYHHGGKGSLKEHWGSDDYSIQIRGLFFNVENTDVEGLSSDLEGDVKKLHDYAQMGLVGVICPLLNLFDIHHMFIESLNFPFDKQGLQLIPWEIKAVSDFRQDELLTTKDEAHP